MPLALSTNWLTVPEGLTQVIEAEGAIPSSLERCLFVSLAASRSSSNSKGSGLLVTLQSIIPVNDTPNKRSSSVFFFHSSDKN